MGYKINLGEWNKIFAIPLSVVDVHIKLAKEDFVKVLLVLLAHAGENLSEKEISDISGVSESNVSDAVNFWIQRSVISINDDVLCAAKGQHTEVMPNFIADNTENDRTLKKVITSSSKEISEVTVNNKIKIRTKEPVRLSGFELSQRIESAEELKWLISETERMFGRFLTQTEVAVLVSMFDYAGLPADVIVMIIEYCISIDKQNLRFIEKTAYSWADQGFDTHQKVEAHITSLVTEKNNESLIKSAFGIWDRNLTSKQKEFVSVWLGEWNFSIEMIKLAYEMCVDNTGKLSFPYINKILASWFEKGISTPAKVEENEKSRQKTDFVDKTFNAKDFDDFSDYTVPDLSKKRSNAKGTQK